MNNPTIKILQRKDYQKKDNTVTIFLRLTIARKPKLYNLHISVPLIHWDENKTIVKKANPNNIKYNNIIKNASIRAEEIVYKYKIENKQLTFNEFDRLFYNKSNSDSVYSFWENQIELFKGSMKEGTIRSYKAQLSKLRVFKSELQFNELELSFILNYEKHLLLNINNCKNTVSGSMKSFKAMINRAIKLGYIKENPFKNYVVKPIVGKREFLTRDELYRLENFYKTSKELTEGEKNVLKVFLFCCYTGLRYGDMKKLKYSNINNNMIEIQMEKTDGHVKIPLTKQSLDLIGSSDQIHFKNQKLMNVYTNQYMNRLVHTLIKKAGINKNITNHCARHTFATLALSLNIPIDVIQKLLGQKDIKTTQIYVHYYENHLISEMDKFNDL